MACTTEGGANSQQSFCGPLQLSPAFTHTHVHSRTESLPAPYPPTPTSQSPGTALAASPGLCGCLSTRQLLRPPWLIPHWHAACLMHRPGERSCSQGKAQTARVLQLPGSLSLTLSLAACSGPHHNMCVCNLPLTLHRHLQLVPAAEHMHAACSSHHSFLPWFLATGHEGTSEDNNSAGSHRRQPTVLREDTVDTVDPSSLSQTDTRPQLDVQ